MKYLPVFALLLFLSCSDKSTTPTYDPTYLLKGTVINVVSESPETGVLVGFKHPDFPDSLLFAGDSVNTTIPNSIDYKEMIPAGEFGFGFSFADRLPFDIKNMFAYKPGKGIWRFSNSRDTIYHLNHSIDSISIKLTDLTR